MAILICLVPSMLLAGFATQSRLEVLWRVEDLIIVYDVVAVHMLRRSMQLVRILLHRNWEAGDHFVKLRIGRLSSR